MCIHVVASTRVEWEKYRNRERTPVAASPPFPITSRGYSVDFQKNGGGRGNLCNLKESGYRGNGEELHYDSGTLRICRSSGETPLMGRESVRQ
jgi:hypothetical protein